MKCRSVQRLLRGAPDEPLPPRIDAESRGHLLHCPACAAYARDLELLHTWVSALPPAEPSATFDWRLRLRLAKAEAGEIPPLFEPVAVPRRGWLEFAVGAAAAAVLVVVAGIHYQPKDSGLLADSGPAPSMSPSPSGLGRVYPVSDGRPYGPQPAPSYSYFIQDATPVVDGDSARGVSAGPALEHRR